MSIKCYSSWRIIVLVHFNIMPIECCFYELRHLYIRNACIPFIIMIKCQLTNSHFSLRSWISCIKKKGSKRPWNILKSQLKWSSRNQCHLRIALQVVKMISIKRSKKWTGEIHIWNEPTTVWVILIKLSNALHIELTRNAINWNYMWNQTND